MTTFTANEKHWRWRSEPAITRVLAILGFGAAAAFFVNSWTARAAKPDANASRGAFLQIYRVLTSPRCQNCHPAGDSPLQGDDGHVHLQNVTRGKDGHGVYGMRYVSSSNESSGCAHAAQQSEVESTFSRAQDGVCWTLSKRALQADQRSKAERRTISRRPAPPHRG